MGPDGQAARVADRGYPAASVLILPGMGDEFATTAELPTLPAEPSCPAALKIAGATGWDQGVVCRAMQRSVEQEPGTGMSAGALGVLRGADAGVFLSLKSDPSSVCSFCHGRAVPVLSDAARETGRASYTYCPVWQAEKLRIAEGRGKLVVEREPEPVSMGVSSMDAPDPWAAAREGLDELAPKKAA